MLATIEVHNDTTDDNNKNPGKNDKAGVDKEHEVRHLVPARRTEGFVNIDEDQRKDSSQSNQLDNFRLFVYVFGYVHLSLHKCNKFIWPRILNFHPIFRNFAPRPYPLNHFFAIHRGEYFFCEKIQRYEAAQIYF